MKYGHARYLEPGYGGVPEAEVYYGHRLWPSYCQWIVPGTLDPAVD